MKTLLTENPEFVREVWNYHARAFKYLPTDPENFLSVIEAIPSQ